MGSRLATSMRQVFEALRVLNATVCCFAHDVCKE